MTLAEKLKETPFGLSLSSRYFGFFSHCGFYQALEENGLRPQTLRGCSAGAIVATSMAFQISPEELLEIFAELAPEKILDPFPGLGMFRGKKMENSVLET